MSQIHLSVVDQDLYFTNMPTVSSGNVQADQVKFTFNSDWDGRAKTAVFFVDEKEPYYRVLDSSDMCMIPDEILAEKGRIYIGVFGVKDGTILTSTLVRYKIEKGAIARATGGVTPELWDQILASYEEIDQEIDELTTDQAAFLVDAKSVVQQVYDALATIQGDIIDMDGGIPSTSAFDVDIDAGPAGGEA